VWVIASAPLVAACGGTDEPKHGVAQFRSRAAQKSYREIYQTAPATWWGSRTSSQFAKGAARLA